MWELGLVLVKPLIHGPSGRSEGDAPCFNVYVLGAGLPYLVEGIFRIDFGGLALSAKGADIDTFKSSNRHRPMKLSVLDQEIRTEQPSGYICLTDLANVKGDGKAHIGNWLRTFTTLEFLEAWERKHNVDFKGAEFDTFKNQAGGNTFRVSAGQLIDAGAQSLRVKRGRYGGTYGAVQVALHFANWLDASFYLETVDSYLHMLNEHQGIDAARRRFSRELAADNYALLNEAALIALPEQADGQVVRRSIAGEMDIVNLAVFGMTAAEWRAKFPKAPAGKNMRDFATPAELVVISELQLLNAKYIENAGDPETRLTLLRADAERLLEHHQGQQLKRDIRRLKKERGF